MSEDKSNTQQAKAAEVAQDIQEGSKTIQGSDKNPVQVATDNLKMGKDKDEKQLREKTEHVGRIASNVTAAAKTS